MSQVNPRNKHLVKGEEKTGQQEAPYDSSGGLLASFLSGHFDINIW